MQESVEHDRPAESGVISRPHKQYGKTYNDTLVDHADRLWQAECENASRIAGRIQLIAGAIIALMGFSMFSFIWLQQTPVVPMCPFFVTFVVHLLLISVVILFAFALGHLYLRQNPSTAHASQEMEISPTDIGDHKPIKLVVFGKTYRAYLELRRRNESERLHLRKGQERFAYAILLILIATFLYLTGSLAYKVYPEALNYEHISVTGR